MVGALLGTIVVGMVVLLQMPDEMKNRVLFNELATFLQAASNIVQR